MKVTPAVYARRKARWTVKDAIRHGKMERGTACEMEGRECSGPLEAHHDDHSKPLVVRWLCRWHHRKVDGRKMARPGNRNGSASARNRTENLAIKSRLLCQLSYGCGTEAHPKGLTQSAINPQRVAS